MTIELFNPNFYRSANSSLNGLSDDQARSHFQNYGLEAGLAFSSLVDLNFYRSSNGDVANFSNRDAYEHLSNYGVEQGKKFSPIVDLDFYRENNSDLANLDNEEIFNHLQSQGVAEGRLFSQFFDIQFYLAANPDVAQAVGGNKVSALNHFAIEGLENGRDFSVAFNVNYYHQANSDLADSWSNRQLLDHFAINGLNEGRKSASTFDVSYYLANNLDLEQSGFNYQDAYKHFASSGLQDGRIASEFITNDYAGNEASTARHIAIDSQSIIFRDSVSDGDTSDFYSFTLDASSSDFELVMNGLTANANVELLNSSGGIITSSLQKETVDELLSFNGMQAGSYYIRVYQEVGSANTNYNLSLQATPISPTPQSPPLSPTPQSSRNSFIEEVVALTNTYRAEAGLAALQLNVKLNKSAQNHSKDMAHGDFFGHIGSNGLKLGDRAKNAGYQYQYLGENIAAGQITPSEVVKVWMDSTSHRDRILNSSYREIGIGYYYLENDTGNENYNHYWTQDFGTAMTN